MPELEGHASVVLSEMSLHALDHAPLVMQVFRPFLAPVRGRGPGRDRGRAARRSSAARTPVVLLHGYGQNRYTWHHPKRSLAMHLARLGYPVFVPELRGHGRSREAGAPWPLGVWDYLQHDLPAFVAAARTATGSERVALVGHSLGGLLALLYAATAPHVVSGAAALASPSPRVAQARLFSRPVIRDLTRLVLTIRSRGWSSAARRTIPYFALDNAGALWWLVEENVMPHLPFAWQQPVRQVLMPALPWLPGSFEPDLARDRVMLGFDKVGIGVVGDMLELAATGRLPGRDRNRNLFDLLERLRCPVLLVASTDDRTVGPRYVLRKEDLPKATVVERRLSGFGHCDLILGTRAPERVWPLLESWLDGC